MEALIDEYVQTRMAYDVAHEASNKADKAFKAAKAKLVEGMVAAQETGKKMDYGLGFSLRKQFSISCNPDNEVEVKNWLHETYGDVSEFTVEKIAKKTVEEKIKDDIEDGKLDEFEVPDFMNLKTRPDVSCTGWKQYSQKHRSK